MKTVAVLLLCFACASVAVLVLRAEKEKCESAEGIYLLLLHIRHGVCEERLPLPEIYASFENAALEKNGFLPLLREKGLAHALSLTPLPLPEARVRALTLYAGELGGRFAAEEALANQKECEAMHLWLEEYRKDLPRRLKIKRTLSLCVGGMILLFLL